LEARGGPAEAATPRGSARCYQRRGAVVEVSISPIRRCDSRDGHSPTYEECIEAMRAEEERRRCKMTDRER
jgi:hypothetical protein